MKSCYLLGRRVAKRKNVIGKLLKEGKFDEVTYVAPLGKMPLSESSPSLEEGLVTKVSTKNEVMEVLKQDKQA